MNKISQARFYKHNLLKLIDQNIKWRYPDSINLGSFIYYEYNHIYILKKYIQKIIEILKYILIKEKYLKKIKKMKY